MLPPRWISKKEQTTEENCERESEIEIEKMTRKGGDTDVAIFYMAKVN